ncbi:hypothetical protein [Alkalilimnicola sp. S0819]|uniref:hypothetical protein n=1 Tax=Alkalilimnicola sp. S0819 TaxID=2613922 RepID=UPI0012616E60|nr:hypothetical protein [Alkalilimnicola sp. S0819]KAB7627948.1 hypothetical protein F3N43_02955 [Alkalilimnicola sp. S0819]MPQ15589.1 hypothetical protein [Alkalilimnicola sp. S0819]
MRSTRIWACVIAFSVAGLIALNEIVSIATGSPVIRLQGISGLAYAVLILSGFLLLKKPQSNAADYEELQKLNHRFFLRAIKFLAACYAVGGILFFAALAVSAALFGEKGLVFVADNVTSFIQVGTMVGIPVVARFLK